MKRAVFAFALTLSALSVAAFDFAGTGFTQESEGSGGSAIVLTDESGGKVVFEAEAEPTAERIAGLRAIVAELRSWKNLAISELRAANSAEHLRITLVPSSFSVDGVDLEAAVPEGIQLFYDKATDYDFKVKSGRYVLRLQSVYTSEDALDAAVLAAYKDPSSFIAARDPLYVQKHLDEAAARLDAIEVITGAGAKTSGPQEGVAAMRDDIAALKAEETARDAQWLLARGALLAALNGSKPINADAAAKLDELKKANPQLTKADAAKALKAAGVTLKSAEISAIYLVDFGEP